MEEHETEEHPPEVVVPSPEIEDIDNELTAIFSAFEERIETIARELRAEIATLREYFSQYATTRRDTPPGERHFYFRKIRN